MTSPKVSVVMSVYNGEPYLQEAVESILNQTFSDFEFIIVDDASDDNSWQILKEFRQKDSRIALVRNNKNIGLTRSLNKGLARARGQYVARQDADDVSLQNRFEKQVEYLYSHPEVVLVSSNIELIDSEGCHLGQSRRTGDPDLVAWYLLFYNYVSGHSVVMFRRKAVIELGGYSEDYPYSQDHELWLRVVEVGDIVLLPDVLLQWRRHGDNISFKANSEQEAFSIYATTDRIARLIGEEVNLAEVEYLRDFWFGRFGDSTKLRTVHLRLRQIYGVFLKQRAKRGRSRTEISFHLRKIIARQFFHYPRISSVRRKLSLKVRGSVYALAWDPIEALSCCLVETSMLAGRLVSSFITRTF